ncbi:MAG TPA: trigger factor [Gemmataceae bacterium]|nr:trigger factor [Gemmataceae bacterium]
MTDETRPESEEQATVTQAAAEAPETENGEAEKEPEKLHQAVEMRDVGPCKKHIKVTIDRDDVQKRLDLKYTELVGEANVPGFRPGKAPRKIIERRFAKDVEGQVKSEVLMASLEQLAEEQDVAPLSTPNLDPEKITMPGDGPMVYEFEVEVRPQFDLPNYKGLKIKRPVKDFNEAEVDEEQRRVLAPYGQLVPKPEGNAQIGDYLIADIYAKEGDRVITDLKEVKIRIESRLAFKDGVAEKFGEETTGAKAGDNRPVEIKISDAAADPGLRGKTLQASFAIKDVKMLRLPELTHEFLHEFAVHTVDQFRERIRVLMQRKLEYMQRQSAREQVLNEIAAASTWDLPQDLLIRQARKAFQRKIMDMRSSGISEQEILAQKRILEQNVLNNTAKALKEHFVLQKIAEVEKIDVDDDEIYDEIERIADQNNESPRRLRARLEKDDLIDVLAIDIVERKVLDLILQNAEYDDVPLGKQEQQTVATVEEQAVPGEMADPTAVPPEEPEKTAEAESQEGTEPTAKD